MNVRRIEVVPYDAAWPQRFVEERELLIAQLPIPIVEVHHIGSTSVEGLEAKPIIDILLEVSDVNDLDRHTDCFESLGYECKGEYGIPGRRFYQKGGDQRTHHIHAFNAGSHDALRHIAFRDYLRVHPSVARAYGALKGQVASSCSNDISLYCDGKADFVTKHERIAIACATLYGAIQSMTRVTVINKHHSNYPDPISFKIGDALKVGELDTEYDGWIRVTDTRGKVGWAPLSLIDIAPSTLTGVATGNYSAKELDVNPGEQVVIQDEHCQWSWVEHIDKGTGWVPSDCLLDE